MSAAQTFNSWSMTSLVKSFFVADRCHVLISRNIIICYHCSYKRVEEPYCFITISFSWSPLSTNMRIPNTAEFIALFVSTGQLTGLQNQRKIDVILFMINTRLTRRFPFHIAGADLGALAEPPCDRPLYTVQQGDTCNSIADRFNAPTLVSLLVTFARSTQPLQYRYQIICGNDEINGQCTNLRPGQVKFILKLLLRIF